MCTFIVICPRPKLCFWTTSVLLTIYHINWWISHFRGIYWTLTASEMELFLILLKGFWPLYNVKRSSVLVVVELLCLPLHFILPIIIIIVVFVVAVVVVVVAIVNIIFIIFVVRIFIMNSLLFLWNKLTVWFCFLQFLLLSSPDPRNHHLVLMHYLNIIWHHLIMMTLRQGI